MSSKVAQRGIALAAIALLAVVVGFAIASRDESSSGDALPERVGEWYTARAAPMDVELEGTTTACGVRLGAKTLGISDPVIPCGAKIYIGFGDQDVLTQVIGTGPLGQRSPCDELSPPGFRLRSSHRWKLLRMP